MNVAALFSGGKDSTYALYITQQWGWNVTHLVTLIPDNTESWMFHSLNLPLTGLLAHSLDIPLVTRTTQGTKEDELTDLEALLKTLPIDGVISGAIASEYQRTRIERVCERLGLKTFTPLWHKDQRLLLENQLSAGFKTMIVGVFAEGLTRPWLGRIIDQATITELQRLHDTTGVNIAGEGGEYETLTLDGPILHQPLIIDTQELHWQRDSGTLTITKAHLQPR
jgi:ABC transporter with metal-binding/Fe-S-binding domain ATP-binding protein